MATLDASLYMTGRPKSAFEHLQDMAAAEDAQQRQQINKLSLLTQQGAFADQQQARDVRNRGMAAVQGLGGSATDEQRVNALRAAGDYGTADALEKSLLERQKTAAGIKKDQAAIDKEAFDTGMKQLQLLKETAAAAVDQTSYEQGLARLAAAGMDISSVPKQFDPAFVANAAREALTTQQRVEQHFKQIQQQETTRHNKAQEGLTARGQNLTDARARDANDINKAAGRSQVVETADGVMIVDKGTGLARSAATMNGQSLPGKQPESVKKELTSIGQQRSVIQGAIDAVEKTPGAFGMARGVATMSGPIAESVAGRFDSDDERKARAYVFNNVSKVINERAGAAQSAQELARLRSFLPADTDDSEQIVSKLRAYQDYLTDLESGTRGTQKTPLQPKASPQTAAPKVGTVDGGYRFKGGNPADSKNWEKVQ